MRLVAHASPPSALEQFSVIGVCQPRAVVRSRRLSKRVARSLNVRETLMKIAILAACIAGIALGACRREEPAPFYEPMKLGSTADRTVAK